MVLPPAREKPGIVAAMGRVSLAWCLWQNRLTLSFSQTCGA